MIELSLVHLRFDVTTTTPLNLAGHLAGNNLRNGLASIMLYATCPETERRSKPTPEHAASCPACWLLAAELEPGTVARGYALVPPQPPRYRLEAGESFSFVVTLFGSELTFLPYIVLAVSELGERGVGPGRGCFAIERIFAVQPLAGMQQLLWQRGESVVITPDLLIGADEVAGQVALLEDRVGAELTLEFLSPLRLEEDGRQLKTPDFSVLFRRLLYRIDELNRQFADQMRRDSQEVAYLYQLADQVRLVEAETRWHELWSNSSRKHDKTPLSGLTGRAVYRSRDWRPLLPWLVWGQAVQVGKAVTKGNGTYQIVAPAGTAYWSWL